MVDILLGDVCVEVLALDEAKEEFVDDLDMRPRHFKYRLVLLRIESLALWIHRRRNRPEKILAKHLHRSWIHGLRDDLTIICDIIQELVQCHSFHFLGLDIRCCVVKVENDVALINLLHEEVLPAVRRYLVEPRQFLEVSLALVGNVESRRVLSFWRPDALRNVFRGSLEVVERKRLGAGFRRGKVMRHCFSGAGWRNMLL